MPGADGRPLADAESAVSQIKICDRLVKCFFLRTGGRLVHYRHKCGKNTRGTASRSHCSSGTSSCQCTPCGHISHKTRVSPPSRRGCGNRKELTPLSSHAFVRSMTWVWCHSRHQAEKLSPSTKAFIIITLIIKKCNNILEYFYISPASRSFSNCNIPL